MFPSNILDNHGAMSRFRSQNGYRSTTPPATRSYLTQQRIKRALEKYIPESVTECRALSDKLNTPVLMSRERVNAWLLRLDSNNVRECGDLIDDEKFDDAILLIMRLSGRKPAKA